MKKLLSIVLSLALLIGVMVPCTVSAQAVAETDNNDTAVGATLISEGAATGVINTTEDVDYYKFESTQDYFEVSFAINDQYLGSYVGDGWIVSIYDSLMNSLLSYTLTNNYTFPRLAFTGTIFVKVQAEDTYAPRNPQGIGYDIAVTQTTDAYWESEINDSAKTANDVEAGVAYRGSLWYTDDVDYYKVTTSNYFTVDFAVDELSFGSATGDGWVVSIFDTEMNFLDSYTVTNTATTEILPYNGTVYIKVTAEDTYAPRCPVNIYYNIRVNSYTDSSWEQEYNDLSTSANVITLGDVYTGNLRNSEDVDYFKFKSTTDAFKLRFSISLDEVSVDNIHDGWTISLYAQDSGALLEAYKVSSIGSFDSITLPLQKNQYYYIKVESEDTYVPRSPIYETYHIAVVDATDGKSWEVEKNKDGVSYATTLSESKTLYGNLSYSSDQDYYKLSVATGGTITVNFKRDESDAASNGYAIKLINPAGDEVYYKTTKAVSEKYSKIAVSKGTYYLIVKAANSYYHPSADINYNVSYTLTPTTPTIKTVVPGDKAIKLTWSKRSDVTGYEIQYSTSSSFKSAKTVKVTKNSTVTTTLKSLTAKKTYYVRLRTYTTTSGKTYYSAWASKSVKTAVSAPTLKTPTGATKSIKLSWSKNSNATGYIIEYSTSSSFKSAKTVKVTSASTVSKTITSLSAKKTYYVRVRAYVTLDKTYYSAWTTAKKVKTK
ncbi:MAG: fibronectin type III domain-containing protein [Clostridia bacterium]|nr:fibronectin type III domain-containing protein [Clostridia bacterium]